MATNVLPGLLPRRRGWQVASCEAVVIVAMLLTAFALRYGHDTLLLLRDSRGVPLAVLAAVWLLCLYAYDLYESPILGSAHEIRARLPLVLGTGAVLVAALEWRLPALYAGQRLSLPALVGVGAGLCAFRVGLLIWTHHPRLNEPVLLIGDGNFAAALRHELHRHSALGMPMAGSLSAPHAEDLRALTFAPRQERWARRLVAAFPGGWRTIDRQLCRELQDAGYRLDEGLVLYQRLTGKLPVEELAQREPEFRADANLRRTRRWGKRFCDFAAAAFGLAMCAPLMLAIAALIRIESPGPAIFRQRRVGRRGRQFTLYKFRTMRVNADHGGPARPATNRDPRCTRVGRWLRRLRLDELPQLVNILRGEMSLVGPRPFVPEQEAECASAIPFYCQRWSVAPGATGWAQVNRGYCATLADNREKLAFDLYYIQRASAFFDLLIAVQTLKVLCLGRGGR
ncbi:MAG TPA: exopolysaccharide biosynthesis polyprenyl glycosylphosphotransferase [Terriglobales bacterium]|nr:exopolysaccharide biosynthesis polyprenyl glycosylphosphotransferase [Terriglobales bacterium]